MVKVFVFKIYVCVTKKKYGLIEVHLKKKSSFKLIWSKFNFFIIEMKMKAFKRLLAENEVTD